MQDLVANSSLQPALCNIELTISYLEPYEGAPFTNFSDYFQCSYGGPFPYISLIVMAHGSGVLHPSSGLVTTNTQVNSNLEEVSANLQTCVSCRSGSATSDAFPVEKITFSH
jgi:hypothetical protein